MSVVMPNWLSAVTSPQATPALEVTGATNFGLQVSTTGSPDTIAVQLQVSIDGSNWQSVASVGDPAGGQSFVDGRAARFMRISLATLAGGSSPTVTASAVAV